MPSASGFRLSAIARSELRQATEYYDLARPGYGDKFVAEVTRVIGIVVTSPELFATVRKDIRRVSLRGFPYGLYYRNVRGLVRVIGVVHAHRNPATWQNRT